MFSRTSAIFFINCAYRSDHSTFAIELNIQNEIVTLECYIGPLCFGYQMIGDSQLLRLSEQCLNYKRKDRRVGLCISGQKISELYAAILTDTYPITEEIMCMIGTNDIIQRTPVDEMINSVNMLVELLFQKKKVKKLLLLTLPPVPRFARFKNHWTQLRAYNSHLLSLTNEPRIKIVQIEKLFTTLNDDEHDSFYAEQPFSSLSNPDLKLNLHHYSSNLIDSQRADVLYPKFNKPSQYHIQESCITATNSFNSSPSTLVKTCDPNSELVMVTHRQTTNRFTHPESKAAYNKRASSLLLVPYLSSETEEHLNVTLLSTDNKAEKDRNKPSHSMDENNENLKRKKLHKVRTPKDVMYKHLNLLKLPSSKIGTPVSTLENDKNPLVSYDLSSESGESSYEFVDLLKDKSDISDSYDKSPKISKIETNHLEQEYESFTRCLEQNESFNSKNLITTCTKIEIAQKVYSEGSNYKRETNPILDHQATKEENCVQDNNFAPENKEKKCGKYQEDTYDKIKNRIKHYLSPENELKSNVIICKQPTKYKLGDEIEDDNKCVSENESLYESAIDFSQESIDFSSHSSICLSKPSPRTPRNHTSPIELCRNYWDSNEQTCNSSQNSSTSPDPNKRGRKLMHLCANNSVMSDDIFIPSKTARHSDPQNNCGSFCDLKLRNRFEVLDSESWCSTSEKTCSDFRCSYSSSWSQSDLEKKFNSSMNCDKQMKKKCSTPLRQEPVQKQTESGSTRLFPSYTNYTDYKGSIESHEINFTGQLSPHSFYPYPKIRMDCFELFFNANQENKRKDLIHLNYKGLKTIYNHIESLIRSRKQFSK